MEVKLPDFLMSPGKQYPTKVKLNLYFFEMIEIYANFTGQIHQLLGQYEIPASRSRLS